MKLAVKEKPVDYIDNSQSVSNFLALGEIFENFDGEQVYQILDMGPVWQSNIEFFSNFRCKLYVEDLYRCMTEKPFGDAGSGEITEYLQPYPKEMKFDVILFWDLFDYITRDQILALLSHLESYCKTGTRLFSVTSTVENIPSTPANFKIIGGGKLFYENTSDNRIPGPVYNQTKLSRIMPRFRLTRAFRMSSGVEETVFVYQG